MDAGIMAILSRIGGRVVNYGFNLLTSPKRNPIQERIEHLDKLIQAIPEGDIVNRTVAPVVQKEGQLPSTATEPPPGRRLTTDEPIALPTTAETVEGLKRRLGKELYRLEMDLQGGARFAGKPCDCLEHKHKLGLEATAEELMSYDTDSVYGEIINWLGIHEYPPKEILKHPPEYFQKLAPELRNFRKRVMGTESVNALLKKEVNDAETISVDEETGGD